MHGRLLTSVVASTACNTKGFRAAGVQLEGTLTI